MVEKTPEPAITAAHRTVQKECAFLLLAPGPLAGALAMRALRGGVASTAPSQ
ncbi:hypothetical protein OG206_31380 [Streptomyces sp. NBC_01341]|uniref:hypothetical protein n=1 Tax=Streptomyces sp. NBC_01341 TaxID=2903831 RepID=UPI002E1400E2|nr:hypothetical protein OG206_31380 [Streptomyces sp. NBC_01341]